MAPQSFFHTGIIVPDLEAAMRRFYDVLGIRFAEPATFVVPRLEDPEPHRAEVVGAFSMTEPPYYELIQGTGDGIFSLALAGQILYHGVWESKMADRLAKMEAAGIGWDALFRSDADSPPFAIITKPDLFGTRIEYVGDEAREGIEAWVATGRYPGGVGG